MFYYTTIKASGSSSIDKVRAKLRDGAQPPLDDAVV